MQINTYRDIEIATSGYRQRHIDVAASKPCSSFFAACSSFSNPFSILHSSPYPPFPRSNKRPPPKDPQILKETETEIKPPPQAKEIPSKKYPQRNTPKEIPLKEIPHPTPPPTATHFPPDIPPRYPPPIFPGNIHRRRNIPGDIRRRVSRGLVLGGLGVGVSEGVTRGWLHKGDG